MVAWRTRHALSSRTNSAAVSSTAALTVTGDPNHPDNIIFDIQPNPDGTGSAGPFPYTSGEVGHSAGGFGHPMCLNNPTAAAVSGLPSVSH